MHRIKALVSRWNSETLLIIALLGLVLFSSSFNLNFVYGITFSFTSIFMFLILRLFGLSSAVFTGLIVLLFVPHNFISVAHGLLLLIEILFVGAFFYKGRKAKMFFVDGLFWLTIGLSAVFFLNRISLSGDALYFQICKDIINGCFNVLIADMFLAYFPFYKLHKNINKNNVSIHQFLSHITLISIFIPFFLKYSNEHVEC